jgi:hypothetical protein
MPEARQPEEQKKTPKMAMPEARQPEEQKKNQMRKFSWDNDDVKEALQQLRNKQKTWEEVATFLQTIYNQTMGKRAIYNHRPATPAADPYLADDAVLKLQTKFDRPMLGIKNGERYRKFQKDRDGFKCTDCKK